MSNILRMNLFRMGKTKITYVFAGVSLLLTVFVFAVNVLVDKLLMAGIPEELVNGGTGFSVNAFEIAQTSLSSGMTAMTVVMFALLFFHADISSGFVKNTVGYTGDKHELSLANSAVTVIYALIVTAISLVVSFALTVTIYGNLEFSNGGKFAAYILVMLLEIIAYTLLLNAFADKTGKNIVIMIFGVVYIMYKDLIYQLIMLGISYFFEKDVELGKYTLLGGISTLKLDSDITDFLISGGIALAVTVGAYFLDVAVLRKREIK